MFFKTPIVLLYGCAALRQIELKEDQNINIIYQFFSSVWLMLPQKNMCLKVTQDFFLPA